MNTRKINFFQEKIDYTLKNKAFIRKWIADTIIAEGFQELGPLNFIFCTDEYLLSINQEYLHHDTYTDIITFDTSEKSHRISGDIFISIERVRENASLLKVAVQDEIHRVIIHGILHLCGYLDKGKDEKQVMTEKEDHYLAKRPTDLQKFF